MPTLAERLKPLTSEQREALATRADTTKAVIDQYAGGHKAPGFRMAQRLVEAAKALGIELSLHECRPDIWKDRKAA